MYVTKAHLYTWSMVVTLGLYPCCYGFSGGIGKYMAISIYGRREWWWRISTALRDLRIIVGDPNHDGGDPAG